MKKYLLFLFIQFLLTTSVFTQKIQYSKGVIKASGDGSIRLLADVNGYHHLLQLTKESNPIIYCYNKDLVLEKSIEIPVQVNDKTEVKIIQLENEYWLYAHTLKSYDHQLYNISGKGSIVNYSSLLSKTADSGWNKTTSTLNLVNVGNNIFVVTNKYFDAQKKAKISFIKIVPEEEARIQHQVYIPFNIDQDVLKDIVLFNNNLYVLKTIKEEKGNNVLCVIKTNLINNQSYTNQFESGKYVFQNPRFRFGKNENAVFIYSMIVAPFGYTGSKPSLFMVTLNETLNEKVPVKMIKDIMPESSASSFIVETENAEGWICFSKLQRAYSNYASSYFTAYTPLTNTFDLNMPYVPAPAYSSNLPVPVAGESYVKQISIKVLNNQMETIRDSLIKNKGWGIKTAPYSYSTFKLNNQYYLIFSQQLNRKNNTLVLIKPGAFNNLQTTPIRAYNRYTYLLPLLQISNSNAFIVPFTTKKEMGLMKVSLTD